MFRSKTLSWSCPEDSNCISHNLFEDVDPPQATEDQGTLEDGIGNAIGEQERRALGDDRCHIAWMHLQHDEVVGTTMYCNRSLV